MSLITHTELVQLVADGVITGVKPEHINGSSIDITLSDDIWVEDTPKGGADRVDLILKETPAMRRVKMHGFFDLAPGKFMLGSSQEVFNLPDTISTSFFLKSSGARAGLDAALAMWADPKFSGSNLTLELVNNLEWHHLRLRPGLRVGQLVFWRGAPVPAHAAYDVRGQYGNQLGTVPSKGIR